ncbi:transposase, partial [Variovorax sp. WDL1]|uniref:transposase n=1 Tax=Variovorax sp. WDL1 TaxID=207745 RepID=UPI0018DE8F7B
MEDSKRVSRRRHAADLKRQVLAACAEPGASVAQVALAHGLNANLVHKWRRTVDVGGVDSKSDDRQAEFVSLTLAPGSTVASDIHLELRRGAIAVNVTWPLSASGAARDPQVIRVDALWLAIEPLDMRAGTEAALARVVRGSC